MAENILRFKVQSDEAEKKLKNASAQLIAMAENAKRTGAALELADKQEVEFVRSLGDMATKSKTAKGSLNELTSAFTDLHKHYKELTDQQKNSDYGKALSESLDKLKGRIQESKSQLQEVSSALGDTGKAGDGVGGVLDSLTSKFGVSLKSVMGWGAAIGAAKAALDVAKDAFFASEQNLDDWNRAVYSAQSVYETFLTSINTGDISGFLSRIDQITQAARQAYDELDRLSTQKAINNKAYQQQNAENTRLRAMLQTGRGIESLDGKKDYKEGQLLTDADKRNIERELQNGMRNLNQIVKDEVTQTGRAISALYDQQASTLGMSRQQFEKGTVDMTTFDKMMDGFKKYQQFEAKHTTQTSMYSPSTGTMYTQSHRDNVANPYEQYKAWGVFKDDGALFGKINELLNQKAALQGQAYQTAGQTYRTINRVEGIKPGIGGGKGSGSKTEIPNAGSIEAQEKLVQELTKKWKQAGDEGVRAGYKAQLEEAQNTLDQMQGKNTVVTGSIEAQAKVVADLQRAWRNAADDGSRAAIKKQLDEAQAALDKLAGTEIPPGSVQAYTAEIKKLTEAQQKATSTEEWKRLADQIKAVTDKIKELKGETENFSKLTIGNVGGYMNQQQSQLSNVDWGGQDYQSIMANVVDTKSFKGLMEKAVNEGIDMSQFNTQGLWEKIINKEDIPDSTWKDMEDYINEHLDEMSPQIEVNVKTGEVKDLISKAQQTKNQFEGAANAIGKVGSALSQIEDPAAKVMGTIAQAIATMMLSYTEACAQAATMGPWAWIAFAATGLATAISSVSAIKQATSGSYAEGGIIPGTSYTGDRLTANVNSGELILNRAQQDNIANQLLSNDVRYDGGGAGGGPTYAQIRGETIYCALNNYLRRSGKGELVTWR